ALLDARAQLGACPEHRRHIADGSSEIGQGSRRSHFRFDDASAELVAEGIDPRPDVIAKLGYIPAKVFQLGPDVLENLDGDVRLLLHVSPRAPRRRVPSRVAPRTASAH